jgi:hypothetical protein
MLGQIYRVREQDFRKYWRYKFSFLEYGHHFAKNIELQEISWADIEVYNIVAC